jgi:exodeoxyribonuclease-3
LVRDRWPGKRVFTYWDYRAGMFHQDLGMRIDLVLATGPLAERVRVAWVDRHARKGSGPSDHAPVIVDLDEAPDGDIGPVVPPPSAPVTPEGDPAAEPQTLRVPLRISAVACDHFQVRKASAFLRIDADILRP